MRIELHDGLTRPQNIEATRVVIYDDYDNPLAVAIKVDDNYHIAAALGQKQFHAVLKAMGIDKAVVVERLDPKRLKPLE